MPWNHVKWHDCPFFHSHTYCVMIPAKDAHVLMVASLEDQKVLLPASALCTTTLQAPVPPGKDAHSYQSSPNPSQQFPAQLGKANRTMTPTQRQSAGALWVADLGSSSRPGEGGGVEAAITKCCILQAWHLVQRSPNEEGKALHFMIFGLDSPPFI